MLISFEIISFIALLAFFNILMLSEVEGLDFTLSSLCDSMYLLIYDISSLNCIFLEGLISLYLPLQPFLRTGLLLAIYILLLFSIYLDIFSINSFKFSTFTGLEGSFKGASSFLLFFGTVNSLFFSYLTSPSSQLFFINL